MNSQQNSNCLLRVDTTFFWRPPLAYGSGAAGPRGLGDQGGFCSGLRVVLWWRLWGGGTTGGSLSPDWATRSTQGICLLSLPTKELKIVDFPGSIPKDHDSAEADSFWSLDQVQNFCHFWGLPSKGLSPWTRLPSSLLQGDRPL